MQVLVSIDVRDAHARVAHPADLRIHFRLDVGAGETAADGAQKQLALAAEPFPVRQTAALCQGSALAQIEVHTEAGAVGQSGDAPERIVRSRHVRHDRGTRHGAALDRRTDSPSDLLGLPEIICVYDQARSRGWHAMLRSRPAQPVP